MTKIVIFTLSAALSIATLSSCHHTTLEDQAEKMAQEYTERNCPTPKVDMAITDSVTFDRTTKTFNYYYRLTDKADDPRVIAQVKAKFSKALVDAMKENTSLKVYKDASYNFNYIYRSDKTGQVLFQKLIKAKDYKGHKK